MAYYPAATRRLVTSTAARSSCCTVRCYFKNYHDGKGTSTRHTSGWSHQQQQQQRFTTPANMLWSQCQSLPTSLHRKLLKPIQSRSSSFVPIRRNHNHSSSSTITPTNKTNTATIPFLLADIGEGIKEVELLQWFVQPGDRVEQFDKICQVQSDKATVEITSRYDGIIATLPHQVGDLCPVGQPLLYYYQDENHSANTDDENDDHVAVTTNDATTANEPESQFQGEANSNSDDGSNKSDSNNTSTAARPTGVVLHTQTPTHTSPAVRKLGREYNLNLSTLTGRGPHGRLLKHDVIAHLQEQGLWRGGDRGSGGGDNGGAPSTTASAVPSTTVAAPAAATPHDEDEPIITLRGYQRSMAQHMTAALQTPHMSFADEVVCNQLLECRAQLNDDHNNDDNPHPHDAPPKISVLALLIQAVSASLTKFPQLNAVVVPPSPTSDPTNTFQYQVRRDHNIGIAMDTARGLVVPVIRQCQALSLLDIQNELDRLKQLARATSDKSATPAQFSTMDLLPPTFSISNIGSVQRGCGTYMQPVLAPPAVCLGAFGAVQRRPRFVETDSLQVYAAQVLTVTWCADHRFVDGATLARFHGQFQHYVEHPLQLLIVRPTTVR